MSERSELEAMLALHLRADGLDQLPGYCRELAFHPERDWLFDFAWAQPHMVAVEIQGWSPFRGHAGKAGMLNDCRKFREAQRLGWMVLPFMGREVRSGVASLYIRAVLTGGAVDQAWLR